MAFLQWRRFTFFDKEVVKDPDTNIPFDKLKDFNVVVCTSGRGQIICGDNEGYFHIISRQLDVMSFKGYSHDVQLLCHTRQNGVLVSVGSEEQDPSSIKVWNFDRVDRHGIPTLLRTVRSNPGQQSLVTVVAVHENLSHMAIGYADGSVCLIKGDITRERRSKQRIIHKGPHPVTGLIFRTTHRQNHLFIVTTNDVFSFDMLDKESVKKIHVLLDYGGLPKCVTITDSKLDSLLVVAQNEAVYFYQPDGHGPCFAFGGEKLIVHWFRGYLIVISKEVKTAVAHPTTSSSGPSTEMNLLTVYNIPNKFIAYSAPIPEVIDVISEWGSIFILTKDRKLFNLMEHDIQSKLDTLFKKNLYVMAIQLAQSQQYDEDGLNDIFRQYGDHLYGKGDHDGAISQYIKTIGKLEASYVIRKFLDAQRIHNLTAYLQALHKKGLAMEDHTTLLLNCYTKLKDIQKLDEFIMTKDREVDFDIDIAIKVCRQASYYKHALFLAEKHQQHSWYLKIQLEDQHNYTNALTYIGKLEFEEAEQNMKKYGKILINQVPEETTEFLKKLCTDYKPSDRPLVELSTLNGSRNIECRHAVAAEFIHIFVKNTTKLLEFLEHMTKVQPSCQSDVYNTLIEVYLREAKLKKDVETDRRMWEQRIMDMLQQPASGYDLRAALILCQINNFKPGILYLLEKAKLFDQIVQYYMDHKDYNNILLACKKFGSHDQNLWVKALHYFVKEEQCEHEYLSEVLLTVEKKKLLPPLMVINTMAKSPTITLGTIKDYLIRQLQLENSKIEEDERLIQQYREETEKMRQKITEIKTSARIFQVSKCSACNHALELPSVHFLCQHSYHQHCFESYSDSESECIVCLPENKKVLDIIRTQEQNRDLHEQFHHQLERAEEGFSVVAEYFGRGVFNTVSFVKDVLPPKQKLAVGVTSLKLATAAPKPKPTKNSNPFDEYDKNLNPFNT